jgi:hypothetical protein
VVCDFMVLTVLAQVTMAISGRGLVRVSPKVGTSL